MTLPRINPWAFSKVFCNVRGIVLNYCQDNTSPPLCAYIWAAFSYTQKTALLPEGLRPGLSEAEQGLLTNYATITRYPGDYEPVSLLEARKAVAMARRVRREIRRFLPKGTLRRRKS